MGSSCSNSRSASLTSSRNRRCFTGCGSSTTPPPSVCTGEYRRITKRSPRAATPGSSSRNCTSCDSPGNNVSPSSNTTRAKTSRGPISRCTRVRFVTCAGASDSMCKRASIIYVVSKYPGCARRSPRDTSSTSTPLILIAARAPTRATSTSRPCVCTPRTRTLLPDGNNDNSSRTRTSPEITVPVTTVPNPCTEKVRSTGKRKIPWSGRTSTLATSASTAARNASIPSPVIDDTGTIGASSKNVSANTSRNSSSTSSSHSSSTRSTLVNTTIPRGTPKRFKIPRCSRVCGITPSSAATTKSARSTVHTPVTIFLTNRSCPGTSIMVTLSFQYAKPISMVTPRSRSSGKVSVSIPVNALTNAVLP